ncbi:uncharacterized protein ENSP00000372125 homolog [Acanthaster planci]|uniref:Uncharacterized protein ENSP00000372125 homolog n=1 Tax=Acanthaster planci TaxID=133434 RepID=A0A8B7ZLS2_ACAPL|nr:uncharacterized protein ENSP00000372125 homolog [Acanthaster planci]XP_022106410.1 uncharacterized protein ENSP00000372125 homolog [Acanthaster planci]XP_022106411.1 uncharacterized protein ENSP00000372125 homolog [Acanthaster planci]
MVTSMASNWRGYFEEDTAPLTARERDRLYNDRPQSWTAFNPRQVQKLTQKHPARSNSKIEISHRMRTYVPDCVIPKPTDPFRLWIESGRKGAPFPPRWDPEYNSNVWRNFSSRVGYRVDSQGRNISELVADMYPIKIPPHSEMSDNTFVKFLSEVPMIKDQKRRDLAVCRSVRELKDFKELKLRSEMRVPPITERGDIVPPKGFKKYEHRRLTTPESTHTQSLRQMTELERDSQRSVLGTHRTVGTRLWKLTFKENHPDYEKMKADQQDKLLHPPKSPIPGEIWFQ